MKMEKLNIGKFNFLSLKKKENENSALSLGSGEFGKKRLSVSVNMLPHEESLFCRVKMSGEECVRRMSDVTILLQAEKYAQVYGLNYFNRLDNRQQASPSQLLRDNMTDEELHNSVVGRHNQHPAELKAISEIAMGELDDGVSAAYAEALKRQQRQQQQQQQPATTDEGTAVSSE